MVFFGKLYSNGWSWGYKYHHLSGNIHVSIHLSKSSSRQQLLQVASQRWLISKCTVLAELGLERPNIGTACSAVNPCAIPRWMDRRSLTGWKIPHFSYGKNASSFIIHGGFSARKMLVLGGGGGQMWGFSKSEVFFFPIGCGAVSFDWPDTGNFCRTKPSLPPYRSAMIADVYNYAYCMRENMGIDINILDVVGIWGPLARRKTTLIKFV